MAGEESDVEVTVGVEVELVDIPLDVEVVVDADTVAAISGLILSGGQWAQLDESAFGRSRSAARKAAGRAKVQALSVLIALIPAAGAI